MSPATAPSSTGELTISCAKPGCHWKGTPAESATHECPTPAEGAAETPAGDPFAGMLDADGLPIADATTDRSLPYWIVWADGAETRIVGTRASMEEASQAIGEIGEVKRGELTVQEHEAVAPDPEPEAAADEDGPILEVPESAEPETQEEVEAWLLAHGNYSGEGIPQDEKTARLDAKLSTEAAPTPEPEPELEEPENPPAATATGEPEPQVEPEEQELIEEPRPWPLVIDEALEMQTEVAAYRWLVVWHPEDETREVELIGRGKTRAEANEVRDNVIERGTLTGETKVYKTQDVLELAEVEKAELEKRREMVEEPDTTVEAEPPPEEPQEPAEDEPEPEDEEPPEEPTGQKTLLDRSQYDREDLAIPKVDGQGVDRIAVAFAGEIMLDRSEPNDVALYNKLTLGKDVELRVAGRVNGTGAKGATNREGDLDVVVGKKSVKVETVYVLSPGELDNG